MIGVGKYAAYYQKCFFFFSILFMIFILTRPILEGVRIIIEELIEVLVTWKLSSAMKSFTQQLAPLEFSWGPCFTAEFESKY